MKGQEDEKRRYYVASPLGGNLLGPTLHKFRFNMKFVALLRGINVGGNNRVEMAKIKRLLESLGYKNVSTYLNSGNIIFESNKKPTQTNIEKEMNSTFGFEIPILIKSGEEIQQIAGAIPNSWLNNQEQRTDVAYLFDEIDSNKILDELPVNKDFIDIRYTKGAVFWNIKRENVYKSKIIKLIEGNSYKLMTIRNINTARALADKC